MSTPSCVLIFNASNNEADGFNYHKRFDIPTERIFSWRVDSVEAIESALSHFNHRHSELLVVVIAGASSCKPNLLSFTALPNQSTTTTTTTTSLSVVDLTLKLAKYSVDSNNKCRLLHFSSPLLLENATDEGWIEDCSHKIDYISGFWKNTARNQINMIEQLYFDNLLSNTDCTPEEAAGELPTNRVNRTGFALYTMDEEKQKGEGFNIFFLFIIIILTIGL